MIKLNFFYLGHIFSLNFGLKIVNRQSFSSQLAANKQSIINQSAINQQSIDNQSPINQQSISNQWVINQQSSSSSVSTFSINRLTNANSTISCITRVTFTSIRSYCIYTCSIDITWMKIVQAFIHVCNTINSRCCNNYSK